MKNKLNNIKNNPEFQEKLKELKPKRTIWGFVLVLLVFFLPELVNFLWADEIKSWIVNLVQNAPQTSVSDLLLWATEKTFDGELSYFNLGLGVAFLAWMFRK